MPVKNCTSEGKPGYKWGDEGKCYIYSPGNEIERKEAKENAINQGIAIAEYSINNLYKFIENKKGTL